MSAAVAINPDVDRLGWLRWRRERGLGASEVATLFGLTKRTPLELYSLKIGEGTQEPETLNMFLGKAAEPRIAEEYEFETEHRLVAQQVCRECERVPFLIATLDAIRDDGRIVEFKLMLGRSTRDVGEEGTDQLPAEWLLQGHSQMIVADTDVVDFAVASPAWDKIRIFPVRRNESLARQIEAKAGEFWDRVISRNPPPLTGASDARYARLFRDADGEVAFDEAAIEHTLSYRALGEEISALTKRREHHKDQIHAALGAASVGLLPGGGRVIRKEVQRKARQIDAGSHFTLYFKNGDE